MPKCIESIHCDDAFGIKLNNSQIESNVGKFFFIYCFNSGMISMHALSKPRKNFGRSQSVAFNYHVLIALFVVVSTLLVSIVSSQSTENKSYSEQTSFQLSDLTKVFSTLHRELIYESEIYLQPTDSFLFTLRLNQTFPDSYSLLFELITIPNQPHTSSSFGEPHLQADPVLAIRLNQAPTINFVSDVKQVLESLPHSLTLPQIKLPILTDFWDEIGFYTKRNFMHLSLNNALIRHSAVSNAQNGLQKGIEISVLVSNYNLVLRNDYYARLRVSVVDEDALRCVSETRPFQLQQFDETYDESELNGNSSIKNAFLVDNVCSSRGQCRADSQAQNAYFCECENDAQGAAGDACEKNVMRVDQENGKLYSVSLYEPTYLSMTMASTGSYAIFFFYLSQNVKRNVMLVAKPRYAQGGPFSYEDRNGKANISNGFEVDARHREDAEVRGSELPSVFDWSYADNGTQVVRVEVEEGDEVLVLLQSWMRFDESKPSFVREFEQDDDSDESIRIQLYAVKCGGQDEFQCPVRLRNDSNPNYVLISIIITAISLVGLIILLIVYVKKRSEARNPSEHLYSERHAELNDRSQVRRGIKLNPTQLDALFPKQEYSAELFLQKNQIDEEGENEDVRVSVELHVCSVCLCEFVQGDMIRIFDECHHFYHCECIDPWIVNRTTCPQCRHVVRTRSGNLAENVESGGEQVEMQEVVNEIDVESGGENGRAQSLERQPSERTASRGRRERLNPVDW
eukprot:CAMPEP_0182444930 /NCGR_PEP_ID=MMETSP1172-20130603/3224_1 /TAXON_ID=708627 /ORGANISM="Timspurckia oligopyrenoides, Strain CCMP3278" /LENGTH=740 /DNA_ID=CAMNT_0024640597 /DNA_START=155 /DNA_END=2374 /DNA_ORIENTATION=-